MITSKKKKVFVMRKLLPFLIFSVLFCCFSCNVQEKEKLLFVIIAQEANIQKQADNTYTLSLIYTHKTVTYFTDRPERKAGKMPVSQFIKMWDKGYKKSPPNGAYVFYGRSDDPFSQRDVELTNPKYDSNSDTLVFTIKSLSPDKPIEVGNIGETAVFIDDLRGEEDIGGF